MSLSTGASIGPYTIGDEIGSGGMGVVFRATDQNLKRDVAIKALPESLASDADRLARFQREAEVLASLNHPNIAQIYGLERADGATALVMELVDGPTLADRIAKGPLPADEALGIATQVADALEAAHSRNIVHRDLKPANIKLRPDGTVKVLDFGIAKALEPDSIRTEPQSPMLTTPATQVGVILGTAAYMSPEQAKGQPVDQRTDIWAFGCLLYEMLTGQLAFGAEDVPTTLARVIANEVTLDKLPPSLSPAVRQAIASCLQKDARKRLADIRDVRLVLQGTFYRGEVSRPEGVIASVPSWRRIVRLVATAVVALVAGIAGTAFWTEGTRESPFVKRFDYDFPEGVVPRQFGRHVLAISPDSRRLIFNTQDGLYLREIGELNARIIPGTELTMSAPAFSPDGMSVAYWDQISRQLKRIAISGGGPVVVVNEAITNPYGITWAEDGRIYFGQSEGIFRVSASGGDPDLIISADNAEQFYGPRLLPDGDTVLFNSFGTPGNAGQVFAQSISTGDRQIVLETGGDARYVSTGHLIYALDGGLFGVEFDPVSLRVSGGPVPLVQGVSEVGIQDGPANYDISADGTLVYLIGEASTALTTLVWVSRDGRTEPIGAPPHDYEYARISPDGTKLVLDARDEEDDIWVWDLTRETLSRLTFPAGIDRFPVWSQDGTRIAFGSSRDRRPNVLTSLYWKPADGTGTAQHLADSIGQMYPSAFLPDGSGILYFGATSGGDPNDDIGVFWFEGEGTGTPLIATQYGEGSPVVSPDGEWLAYSSDESGQWEVYVRPFPDVEAGRWQVSAGGGDQPLWANTPSGLELYYRNGDAVYAVPVDTEPTFVAGAREELFRGDYVSRSGRSYDVSPDGQRFLMISQLEADSPTYQVIIALDWFTELQRQIPVN